MALTIHADTAAEAVAEVVAILTRQAIEYQRLSMFDEACVESALTAKIMSIVATYVNSVALSLSTATIAPKVPT